MMSSHLDNCLEQLRETCKLSQARWAAWIQPTQEGWSFVIQWGLSQARSAALSAVLRQPKTMTWLAGSFSSGRMRTRQIIEAEHALGCRRLYVFPNPSQTTAIIVGADQLSKLTEHFFKILALNTPSNQLPASHPEEPRGPVTPAAFPYLDPLEAGVEVSYDPQEVLEHVLELLARSINCDCALMSIRAGEVFRIQALWNCSQVGRGIDIPVAGNPHLSELVATRQGFILTPQDWEKEPLTLGFGEEVGKRAGAWMGLPVVIGQRVIGHLAFVSDETNAFSQADLDRVAFQSGRLAYVVENAVVLAEASRYLQQLALLNELASAASLAIDTNEVAYRVMQRLRRIFHTDQAGVFLLSLNGKLLREYGIEPREAAPTFIAVDNSLVGNVVTSGLPVRIADLHTFPGRQNYFESPPSLLSLLAVPLKYRGGVIGVLALTSALPDAFSLQDEQLLVMIASHLAGLFENVRLNEETRQRAHNLNMIHQVVQHVVGLTELAEIAQVTAELMAARFAYDLVGVTLFDQYTQAFVTRLVSEPGLLPASGFAAPGVHPGVSGLALSEGQSRLINNTDEESAYVRVDGWRAGSEMCVPLKEGDRVLGVIDVQRARKHAFTENDLLALEALAGVLSSVVLSAHRYQQLQESVRKLEAVRQTGLDIAADLELDALLKGIVHRAKELVGVKGAELGLLDDKEQAIRILVSDTPWYPYNQETIPMMAGVAGRVAAFGEPVVVHDYNHWNGRLFPEKEAPFKTVAGVPLKFQGQVIGTLTVIDDRPDWVFGPEHIQLLELLAPQAAVSIRNARLYQELQERIEAQRLAENRLIRSARLAAVGEMAAGVAHELNNPLTTVSGFVELVLDEIEKDSVHKDDLELVLREAQRARGVVRRLLDFSRPSENRHSRADINGMVGDVLALVNHLMRTGGVELVVDLRDPLPWVSVDPGQIKQVLLNLVHNGIQAMPSGGHMTIHTDLAVTGIEPDCRQWVTVSVSDNGDGISPENLERIFEPFFTTRPAGKGTGLGLSVSYGIVTDHGGYIEVDSQVGRGSCFSVFLPVEGEDSDG